MKRFLKGLAALFWILVIVAVAGTAAGLIYLSVTEYDPENEEEQGVFGSPTIEAQAGDKLKVMTFDISSGIVVADVDYFADGGASKHPSSYMGVNENMDAVTKFCTEQMCHVNFFQTVDIDSKRSYSVDEASLISNGIYGRANAFAPELKCAYVPFPVTAFTGRVESGSLTLTRFNIDSAVRRALPNDDSWPASTWSEKPCMLIERVKLGDTTKELVLINVDFTKTDDGSVRQTQYKELCEFMQMEFAKGSYVIAGGSFNASLPSVDKNANSAATDTYTPCELTTEYLTGGWKYCTDDSTPTMRIADKPYGKDSSVYVTDGFITSPNTIVENTKTIDTGFKYSTHNPVVTEVTLVK